MHGQNRMTCTLCMLMHCCNQTRRIVGYDTAHNYYMYGTYHRNQCTSSKRPHAAKDKDGATYTATSESSSSALLRVAVVCVPVC
jgi:hypothetical protein